MYKAVRPEFEAKIFSTHLMILEDEGFLGKIREAIRVQKHSGLYAVRNVVAHYVQLFEEIDDPYIADKIADIEDVGKRLLNALSKKTPDHKRKKGERGILVASLSPLFSCPSQRPDNRNRDERVSSRFRGQSFSFS